MVVTVDVRTEAQTRQTDLRIVAPKVTGSSPVGHPTFTHGLAALAGNERQGLAHGMLQLLLQCDDPANRRLRRYSLDSRSTGIPASAQPLKPPITSVAREKPRSRSVAAARLEL